MSDDAARLVSNSFDDVIVLSANTRKVRVFDQSSHRARLRLSFLSFLYCILRGARLYIIHRSGVIGVVPLLPFLGVSSLDLGRSAIARAASFFLGWPGSCPAVASGARPERSDRCERTQPTCRRCASPLMFRASPTCRSPCRPRAGRARLGCMGGGSARGGDAEARRTKVEAERCLGFGDAQLDERWSVCLAGILIRRPAARRGVRSIATSRDVENAGVSDRYFLRAALAQPSQAGERRWSINRKLGSRAVRWAVKGSIVEDLRAGHAARSASQPKAGLPLHHRGGRRKSTRAPLESTDGELVLSRTIRSTRSSN